MQWNIIHPQKRNEVLKWARSNSLVKRKKTVMKDYIVYNSTYMKIYRLAKSLEIESGCQGQHWVWVWD